MASEGDDHCQRDGQAVAVDRQAAVTHPSSQCHHPSPSPCFKSFRIRGRSASGGTSRATIAWGELSGPTWSIELNIGSEDPVDSVMLHIRGSGDDVLTPVLRLAEALRCKVLDCAEGDLITSDQTLGWHAFQQFRDRVVGTSQ